MNHYWQLIQKEHLFGLAAQTRMGVIRTVKPILPAETNLPQWPQRSRHALVQPLSASVLRHYRKQGTYRLLPRKK